MIKPLQDDNLAQTLPLQVGVLGGGRMGAGIAHAFLTKGSHVTVVERDNASVDAARKRIDESVGKSLDRGLAGEAKDYLTRLSVTAEHHAFSSMDLVVEAVPEDWDLKVASLREIEAVLSPNSVLASNTSSLSVTALGNELQRPENFFGLHFFNPVPASTLIEVVIGKQTRPELVEVARRWVQSLGKTAVVVNDAPGFASSRLGVAIALEAMRMLEEGVASAEDIDNAMVLGYKHPTGPLRTTDIVGLDVRLGIAEYLNEMLGERFSPPRILKELVSRGELGRKSGKGFYDWD